MCRFQWLRSSQINNVWPYNISDHKILFFLRFCFFFVRSCPVFSAFKRDVIYLYECMCLMTFVIYFALFSNATPYVGFDIFCESVGDVSIDHRTKSSTTAENKKPHHLTKMKKEMEKKFQQINKH